MNKHKFMHMKKGNDAKELEIISDASDNHMMGFPFNNTCASYLVKEDRILSWICVLFWKPRMIKVLSNPLMSYSTIPIPTLLGTFLSCSFMNYLGFYGVSYLLWWTIQNKFKTQLNESLPREGLKGSTRSSFCRWMNNHCGGWECKHKNRGKQW